MTKPKVFVPLWIMAAALLVCASTGAPAQTDDDAAREPRPVKEVAAARLSVGTSGTLPLELSADWSAPLPAITRAVVILHGYRRDADAYFRYAMRARADAGEAGRTTLVIAPQFLASVDVDSFGLPSDTLRWTARGWEGGDPALGPVPVSSFDALDAILARLADRRFFPALAQVVVAGHSGGAQVVQRYAIAAKGDRALAREGISVRYVVADPSSYAYFSSERPEPSIAAACQGYDRWKYGMEQRPPYLAGPTVGALEKAYVARRVIYLLGTRDDDPEQRALDKSCMAEAEGADRHSRGHAYVAAMQKRDNGTPNHSVWDVPGVGH